LNRRDLFEDSSFFLYIAPIVVAIAYGIYEWNELGKGSGTMPQLAYFIVTKSPYLFLVSIVLICVAIMLDVQGANPAERDKVITANSIRLIYLAIAVIIVSFLAAINVVGYTDLAQAFANFLNGRFPLIFGFLLIGTSILLTLNQLIGRSNMTAVYEVVGLLLLAASPAVLYGALRIHLPFSVAFGGSIVSFALGMFLLLSGRRLTQRPKTASVVQAQSTAV